MISNTAVPIYYGQFRDDVLSGKIPVNKEISLQMNLIDNLIRDPNYYYDGDVVEGFIKYCEDELTLVDGSDVKLFDSFKLWAEDLLGWYYYQERATFIPDDYGGHYERRLFKKRLRNKQYLIVARGAAKSMYLSFIQSYFLNIDTSTTDQITTAPTMKQAEEVMFPIRTSITRSKGPLFKFLTEGSLQNTTGSRALRQKLCSTKDGIKNFLTNSIIRILPMSIEKLQGLRCKVATVDEWLSCDIREDPIGTLEQGASKMDDYIIVAASSEGTVRNGVGDSIKIELMKILKGEYKDPHTSIWYYKLDDIKEVNRPETWRKANPNLGMGAVSYETYQRDVERAEMNPDYRNDMLAKRFGIPMEGLTYFFTYEETRPFPRRDFCGMPCAMGGDMSRGDDFCSFDFLFPLKNGEFGLKTISFITDSTYSKLPIALKQKYDDFINEGTLTILPGPILDMETVYEEVDKHITNNDYDVICFGYDPYNAKAFVDRWVSEHGEFGVLKVIQGAKTESVPLGEIKKLSEDRALIFDEDIVQFAMGNAITMEDTNGNRKLTKDRRDKKIDVVSALMDALVAYKDNKDSFF